MNTTPEEGRPMSDPNDALQKAHEEWMAARSALVAAEKTGIPPLLSDARYELVDRERDAYDALTDATIAQFKED